MSKQNISSKKVFIIILIVFVISFIGSFYLAKEQNKHSKLNDINQFDEDGAQKTETSAIPTQNTDVFQVDARTVSPEVLKESIQNVIAKHPELSVGVSFVNIKTGNRVDVNGDQFFVAASTIKVLVAIDFLHQLESGKYSLETPINNSTARYHLEQMIRWSNNNSWYAFNNLLTYKGEQAYAKSIGIEYEYKTNSISPNNMTALLTKLYKYELLSKEHTDLLLSFMDKTKLMKLIPESQIDAKTYNKSGRLDGLVHDAAILDNGVDQFSIAIFTDGKTAMEDRIELFHEITENAYNLSKTN